MIKRFFLLLAVAIPALTGCRAAPPSTPTALPTASGLTNSAIGTPTAISTPNGPSEQALQACGLEQQESALRSGHLPDWDTVPISTCYQLQVELLPAVPGYQGSATITFTNPAAQALQSLVLRTYPNARVIYGGSLQITSADVDGMTVQPEVFLSDETAVRLPLDTPLAPGKTVEAHLTFEGQLPQSLQSAPQLYGVFYAAQDPLSFSMANWYPILAELEAGEWQAEPVSALGDAVVSPAALYEVRLNAPQDWQVAASGTEVEPGVYTTGPMRDFMLVASPQYTIIERTESGLRIRLFSLPGSEGLASETLQAASQAVELFEERFGPYPYNELDIAVQPLNLALGVEYPGLFTLKDTLFNPQGDRPWLLNLVTAHEAGHQWWYGVVGNDVLENPWQDEALATFSSLLYQESYEPANFQGTLTAYQRTVEQAVETAQDPSFARGLQSFVEQPVLYSPLVYQRGALFYLALREKIGSQAFYAGLQRYYETQRFRIAQPQALLQAFETSCACELDDFYADWDIGDGISK